MSAKLQKLCGGDVGLDENNHLTLIVFDTANRMGHVVLEERKGIGNSVFYTLEPRKFTYIGNIIDAATKLGEAWRKEYEV